jgi:predicted lipoprotein with Yx(FWY)xxD motif
LSCYDASSFIPATKKKGDKAGDGIGGVWHIVSE